MGIPVKIITFIVEAVLVILAVFLFSYFDPFNIFNSKKLVLKDTPTIVTSIRGIGQLITAEYYGEVIRSSTDSMNVVIDANRTVETERLIQIEKKVKSAVDDVPDEDEIKKIEYSNKRKFYRAFVAKHPEIATSQDFKDFIDLVKDNSPLNEKEILFAYYGEKPITYNNRISRTYKNVVDDYVAEKFKLAHSEQRKVQRNTLILLGRGWVKAGIDFSNFDAAHFKYYPERNLVRLIHHQPEIISSTINPWFIPEMKMKGFDFIYVGKQIEKDPDNEKSFKVIQAMKKACLDNLESDAKQADILGKAQKNAEYALSHFISLLLGKEITVEIYKHPLDAALHDILKSARITPREVEYVDSLVGAFAKTEFSRTVEFLQTVRDALRKKGFVRPRELDSIRNWEPLAFYYKISDDGFYSAKERDSVAKYVGTLPNKPSAKDISYFVLQDTTLSKEIIEGKYNRSTEIDSLQHDSTKWIAPKVQNYRKHMLIKLAADCEKLRTILTANEINRCDEIIKGFIANSKIVQAYDFARETESYGFGKLAWPTLQQDWQILSLVTALQKDSTDETARKRLTDNTISKAPTAKEYFYYLLYNNATVDQMKSNKVWGTPLKRGAPKPDSVMDVNVRKNRQTNVESLKTFLIKKNIPVPKSLQ